MQVIVELPPPLRQFSAGAARLTLPDTPSLADAIAVLSRTHPSLSRKVISADGSFYDFVGVFLNRRSVAGSAARDVKLADGDVLSLLPAMAGG